MIESIYLTRERGLATRCTRKIPIGFKKFGDTPEIARHGILGFIKVVPLIRMAGSNWFGAHN
jgi:hypothetical protein